MQSNPTLAPSGRLKSSSQSRRRVVSPTDLIAWMFIAPNVFGVVVFIAGPVVAGFLISFTEWNLLSSPRLVGLQNYREMLRDPLAWQSLKNTLLYSLMTIPGGMVVSLLLALGVNHAFFTAKIYRTIYFVPVITSTIAVALVWKWIYNEQYGLLNFLLPEIGLPQVGWLTNPRVALVSVAVLSVWKSMGYYMVLFLAGLQGIPRQYHEAAAIDGAGSWRRFWDITIPLLSPTLFFVLIISVIGSFQVFDQVYVMTQGGPGNATLVYNYYLYQNAFQYFRMGYASALAYALFALIFGITLFQVKFLNNRVQYDQT